MAYASAEVGWRRLGLGGGSREVAPAATTGVGARTGGAVCGPRSGGGELGMMSCLRDNDSE